jgi:hypothetical protein
MPFSAGALRRSRVKHKVNRILSASSKKKVNAARCSVSTFFARRRYVAASDFLCDVTATSYVIARSHVAAACHVTAMGDIVTLLATLDRH